MKWAQPEQVVALRLHQTTITPTTTPNTSTTTNIITYNTYNNI